MEIILREKIRNVGALGEKVKVKSGYGRNYLIPQGKAVFATPDNIAKFEEERAELVKIAAEHIKAAEARKAEIEALGVITIATKAGEEGKLFGSIGTRDIAEAITKAGAEVDKNAVHLPGGVLRQTGDYEVEVELHSEVSIMVKVTVKSDAEPSTEE